MAIDTRAKRQSCVGINCLPAVSVNTDADETVQHRQAIGYGYAGGLTSAFEEQRQAIINGLDAASSPALGWNDEVRDKLPVTAVKRTSNTVVTITLTAAAAYNISSQEVITATAPAAALVTSGIDITGAPTFTVDPVGGASIVVLRRRRESA